MPPRATDPTRLALVVVAVTSVAMTAFAFRIVNDALAGTAKPVPTSDLASVSAFLQPLSDTGSLAAVAAGTMVVQRDPFGAQLPAARVPVTRSGSGASVPATGAGQQWVVSSILFEDSKRSAIVNNAWVNVGDQLGGGARVTAIERKYVIVTDANGNRHIVPIQGGAL